MTRKIDDIPTPDGRRYIATKLCRVNAVIFVDGIPVTYSALFACAPYLMGVATVLRDVSCRIHERADALEALGKEAGTRMLRIRAYAYQRMASLIVKHPDWPESVYSVCCGVLPLGDNEGSITLSEDYSWSLHNA